MTRLIAKILKISAREPLWPAVAMLTLALGIGVNTAIFSVVRAVLLRDLPYPDADRLVFLHQSNVAEPGAPRSVTPADYFDWRRTTRSFDGLTSYSVSTLDTTLLGKGETRLVRELHVDGNFFDVLGVRPALGGAFRADDALAPEHPVVVLSQRLWRELGASPELVGQTLRIEGVAHEVRGVMPAGFAFPSGDVDLWTPLLWPSLPREGNLFRRFHTLRVVARLRPGVSEAAARSDLKTVAATLARAYPETNRNESAGVMPLRDWLSRDVRPSLLLLWATTGSVLLIACANVASLQMIRGIARSRELATQVALGAPRGALLRNGFLEVLVLACGGGLLGLSASDGVARSLVDLFPGELPASGEIAADLGVALFAALLIAASALLAGFLPAYLATRRIVADALKLGGPATPGPRRSRSLFALVLVETALTAMLLVGVGFLVRSFVLLEKVDPGFEPRGVLTLELALPWSRFPTTFELAAFYERLLGEVRRVPGVEEAALTDTLPLQGLSWEGELRVEGRSGAPEEIAFHHRVISASYFPTMRVPLLRGSSVPEAGSPALQGVVINQTLAQRCFGKGNPIGQRVRFLRGGVEDSGWIPITGVAGAERIEGLTAEPRPDLFESYLRDPDRRIRLAVRSDLPRDTLLGEIRRISGALDPSVPVARPRSMEEIVRAATARERFLLALMGSLAGLAATLAGVGIFAVTAYLVAQRRREIGIRLSFGATQQQVQRALVGESMRVVALGGALGIAAALTLVRLLRRYLFGIAPTDAAAILLSALALAAVTVLPAYFAARRAARIGPDLPLREG